jgi:hypothetical protein
VPDPETPETGEKDAEETPTDTQPETPEGKITEEEPAVL